MYDRLRCEWLLMGKKVFYPQILLLVGGLLFAITTAYTNGPVARLLSAVLEMLLPLATGASVAILVSSDPALELQLTLPWKYALTVSFRLTTLVLWNSCLAFITNCIVFALRLEFFPLPQPAINPLFTFLISQLVWLPSLLVCTVFGFGAALLLQSRAASVSLLAGFWLMEILFKTAMLQTSWFFPLILFPTTLLPDALTFSEWLINRLLVLGVAGILLLASWPLLLFPERLVKGSQQE